MASVRLSQRVMLSLTTMEASDMAMEDMASMVWGPMEALVMAIEAMESLAEHMVWEHKENGFVEYWTTMNISIEMS